jgi:uncharacterized RDD family membrane protein YckC
MEPRRDPETPSPSDPTPTPPPADLTPATPPPAPAAPSAPAPPLAAGTGKPDSAKRFLALFIDGIIAGVIYGVLSAVVSAIAPGNIITKIWIGAVVGGLAGGAYMLLRDGLDFDFMKGRSLGKKIIKLRPERLDGGPMDLETSIKRNWTLCLGYLGAVPVVGWILGLASLGLGIYEIYKVLTDPQGRRWGDELAGTKVVETAT